MRKFYIIALACAIGIPATFAGRPDRTENAMAKHRKLSYLPKPGKSMVPLSETVYEYNEGVWDIIGTTVFTYDARGNVLTEVTTPNDTEEYVSRKVRTYDEFDQVLTEIQTFKEGADWINYQKTEYVWDTVVHDFFTTRMGYSWGDGTWTENYYCETDEVTRNTDGNVTQVLRSLPLDGRMIPGYRLQWTYGAEGRASEYAFYANYSGDGETWELSDGISMKNLQWNRTNGQLLEEEVEDYFEGDNRLARADVYYEGELDGHIIVEYYEDRPQDYYLRNTLNDENVNAETVRKTVTDANGSFTIVGEDYFDDDDNLLSEPASISTIRVEYDDKGNVVLEEESETYDGMTETMGQRYDLTYDDKGNVKEVIQSMFANFEDEETDDPVMKIVYGDYIAVNSGISDIAGDSVEAWPAIVYNAQGAAVATVAAEEEINTLPAGLYIVNGKKYIVR